MPSEMAQLFETAMYKEIAAEAVYAAAQRATDDPGAKALMKELAAEEHRHSEMLGDFRQRSWQDRDWHQEKVADLMISEYLAGSDTLEGAGLQETYAFAIKREQDAVEFYSRLMSASRHESAKRLCAKLVAEELRHKLRLELVYDDLFFGEN